MEIEQSGVQVDAGGAVGWKERLRAITLPTITPLLARKKPEAPPAPREPSLWKSPADELGWRQLERFCALAPVAGARLAWSGTADGLEREVASLANTSGGLVLVGVAGDAEGRPCWPPAGVPLASTAAALQRRLWSGMRPGLGPELLQLACPSTPGSGVVVVRVAASGEAPHALLDGTVLVRSDAVPPLIPAERSWLERLQRRGARHLSERARLHGEIAFACAGLQLGSASVQLTVSPLAPGDRLQEPADLFDWALGRWVLDPEVAILPREEGVLGRRAARGSPDAHAAAFALDARGFGCFVESLTGGAAQGADGHDGAPLAELLPALARTLREAGAFLRAVRFGGTAAVRLALRGLPAEDGAAGELACGELELPGPMLFSPRSLAALAALVARRLGYEAGPAPAVLQGAHDLAALEGPAFRQLGRGQAA